MFGSLKRLWVEHIAGAPAANAPGRTGALQLAAAALLIEVMQADAQASEQERTVIRAGIQSTFGLSPAETDELMRLAEEESRSAASIYEFTALVDKGFDAEQKKRIVELLWLVAFPTTTSTPSRSTPSGRSPGSSTCRTPTSSTPSCAPGATRASAL